MGFKQVTFRIEEKLAQDLKAMAFHEEKTQTQLVTEFIERGLREYNEQTTLDVEWGKIKKLYC